MKLSKYEAAKLALDTATQIVAPIVQKIDPYNLQRGFREAKIGLYYAIDMLVERMMTKKIRQAIETSKSLVDNYPSHGYGIFFEEAKYALKLTVYPLESLPEWSKIEQRFNEYKDNTVQTIDFQVL